MYLRHIRLGHERLTGKGYGYYSDMSSIFTKTVPLFDS
jgi:hypothetical protein